MLDSYAGVFRAPGTKAFCTAGVVMRLPIAMYPIGLVLLIALRTGHYSFAGLLSGAYIAGGAVGYPVLARLIDRVGQGRVLGPASALHIAAVATLGVLAHEHAPDWTLLPAAVVAGFAFVPVGSLIRARWFYVLDDPEQLSTAYSLESVLDELIFVIGPLVTTFVATQADPLFVLVIAVVSVGGGAVWLRTQSASEPPPRADDGQPHPSALVARGMLLAVGVSVFLGGVFATAEISMVAFCGQHGHRAAAGSVLAAFAFGSGVSGLAYGSRTWRANMHDRLRLQAAIFAALTIQLLVARNVPTLAACAFVAGLGIAPTLIALFGLVGDLVEAGSLTEGLSWVTTGLNLGYGVGSAVVGAVADAHGARVGFVVTIVSAVGAAALAWGLHARIVRAWDDGPRAALP